MDANQGMRKQVGNSIHWDHPQANRCLYPSAITGAAPLLEALAWLGAAVPILLGLPRPTLCCQGCSICQEFHVPSTFR